MTPQERNARRAKIMRRSIARRVSLAQREIWRQRRIRAGRETDPTDATDEEVGVSDDLLAELPDDLLG